MKGAGLIPFDRLFPQQAMAEVRVIAVLRHPTLPDDEYGLLEFYYCAAELGLIKPFDGELRIYHVD